jgi:hypothetical protein
VGVQVAALAFDGGQVESDRKAKLVIHAPPPAVDDRPERKPETFAMVKSHPAELAAGLTNMSRM